MTRAMILAGTGRYDDPWHDFAATAHQIAGTLEIGGISCDVRGTKRAVFGGLNSVDLLVVNSGRGWSAEETPDDDAEWVEAHQALREYLASNRPVIGIHTASNTFHGIPEWYERLGVTWHAGISMHPPIGPARVEVVSADHPVTAGFDSFELFDERYSRMEVDPAGSVLAVHDLDGEPQPLVVAREQDGRRTVYDALGHGVESYQSPQRRGLLLREAAWALGDDRLLRQL